MLTAYRFITDFRANAEAINGQSTSFCIRLIIIYRHIDAPPARSWPEAVLACSQDSVLTLESMWLCLNGFRVRELHGNWTNVSQSPSPQTLGMFLLLLTGIGLSDLCACACACFTHGRIPPRRRD